MFWDDVFCVMFGGCVFGWCVFFCAKGIFLGVCVFSLRTRRAKGAKGDVLAGVFLDGVCL